MRSRLLSGALLAGLVALLAAGGLRHGAVAARAHLVSYGGDGYQYGLIAGGGLDLVIESGLKLHDWAALVPVVEGAGGTMCDWNGEPLHAGSDGHVLAIGDPARLEDVLAALGR